MAVDAEGSQVETWLVRIAGAPVAGTAKSKPQWKYVALLISDSDPAVSESDPASDTLDCTWTWHYAPLQKLTPLSPIDTDNGTVVYNYDGTPKRSYNGTRHHGDKLLKDWVPQSINTLSKKAGGLTPRVKRAKK